MPYSDQQMREIERCPERLRAYYWRVATNARVMAADQRERARRGFIPDGALGPDTLEAFACSILDNIDALVRTTQVHDHGQ